MPQTIRSPRHVHLLELLVEARRQAGLTQTALAARLGRPRSFVAKYETGERRIDVVEFIELAEALGERPSVLFDRYVLGLKSSTLGS